MARVGGLRGLAGGAAGARLPGGGQRTCLGGTWSCCVFVAILKWEFFREEEVRAITTHRGREG
eukprot:5628909-Pyramimonas_sp.AAC.1